MDWAQVPNLIVQGQLVAGSFTPPNSSIGNSQIAAGAGIEATKLQQQIKLFHRQKHGTVTVTWREVIHVAHAAGNLTAILAGHVVPIAGAATVVIDILKNGVSMLSSTITLNSTNNGVAFDKVVGAFASSGAYVAYDVIEASVVATAGGGTIGQGLFVDIVGREAPGV